MKYNKKEIAKKLCQKKKKVNKLRNNDNDNNNTNSYLYYTKSALVQTRRDIKIKYAISIIQTYNM